MLGCLLALMFQVANLAAMTPRDSGCSVAGSCECCVPDSCPCATNPDSAPQPLPTAPAEPLLKLAQPAPAPDPAFRLGADPGEVEAAAVGPATPAVVAGFRGVRLSVSFCRFLI